MAGLRYYLTVKAFPRCLLVGVAYFKVGVAFLLIGIAFLLVRIVCKW